MLNKWELIDDADRRLEITAEVKRKLYFTGDSPVLKISRLRQGRQQAAPGAAGGHRAVPPPSAHARREPRHCPDAQQRQPAAHGVKVMYALQGATDPPTFTLFVNRELPHTYLRYLERSIREAFDFGSTPIKLRVRKRSE